MRFANKSLKAYGNKQIGGWVEILTRQLPGFISLDDEVISLNTSPDKIRTELQEIHSVLPPEYREMYQDAFDTK